MSQDPDRERGRGSDLSSFEKNRFFHGKLMTARDMQAEQDYHVGRLNTLTRLVAGRGIVRGLNVTEVTDVGDEIEVTIDPGVAVDGAGRPIVVETTVSERLPSPSGDEIHLFLRHEERSKDRVPVQGSDRTYEEDCTYNRILETFDLYYQDDAPDLPKPESGVEFPSRSEVDDADPSALVELARRYHQDQLEAMGPTEESDVFLASYEHRSDGWEQMEETQRRPHVYTNDMLYDALVNHVAVQENPHEVSFEGADLESVGDLLDRLDELEQRVGRIDEQKSTLERYVMNETLEDKIGAFQYVAAEFDSGTAEEIAERARNSLDEGAITGRGDYLDFVETVLEREAALEQELDGDVTSDSLERYSGALTQLETTVEELADDESVIAVAEAQKKVCEAAESLTSG